MDVSSIVSLARTLTHTDSNQITDADAMTYLNLAYKRIANVITSEIDEDYFWDIFDTDTFANQSEYVLPI